ncbi:MAG: sigma 54-interacting transcriptional regulator, partial [Geminicoccaceae bacterium]|nr:sigma 54-interacting transcriptional regulator [Geminicoccaceae bacterium]
GGTLFLDEIGDMPLEAQTRLLRVLQQGEFVPVGGTTAVAADLRIVAASHRDLRRMVQEGAFREDLFYRLAVVPVRLPPLRERLDDIPALVRHFAVGAHRDGLPLKSLDADAMRRLKAHDWPGNVRELENLVRRLSVLYAEEIIGEACIVAELEQAAAPPAAAFAGVAGEGAPGESLSAAVERHLRRHLRSFAGDGVPVGIYQHVLREVERPLITGVLAATKGNQLRAADMLGLNRNTLRKKIRELDIQLMRGP